MLIWYIGVSAVVIGLTVGYTLQRGRACTNTAFRNLFLIGNSELFSMVVIVVCIEIIGYYFLSINPAVTGFQENPLRFSYIMIPVGGFIFGIGTVIAGGCAGGVCYRVGEGSVSSFVALLGFIVGIGILQIPSINLPFNQLYDTTELSIQGAIPSLTAYLPRWIWSIIAAFILLFVISKYQIKQSKGGLKLTHLLSGWTPVRTGVLLGLLGISAKYFSSLSGRNFGLSTVDGIVEIVRLIVYFEPMKWAGLFILFLIIGSTLSSIRLNSLKFSKLKNMSAGVRFFLGGILLGTGSMIAGGCNFGHIFGGIPELGISSIFALLFMLLGNGVTSYLVYNKFGFKMPISTPIKL